MSESEARMSESGGLRADGWISYQVTAPFMSRSLLSAAHPEEPRVPAAGHLSLNL